MFGPHDTQVRALSNLKNLIEANGGIFVIVSAPRRRDYIEHIKSFRRYHEVLFDKMNKYLGKSLYVGSINPDKYNMKDDYFHNDGVHVFQKGYNIFTEQFAKEIRESGKLEPKFITFDDYLAVPVD